ncbi:MAG: hypothetical protein Q6354_08175, partial [Candidatus Brocadiales bacterium]|nr:hypothetical protein [Candidatus Brocadiales bacterium]
SVYFEAGFAQRDVPVIYTCRKDHFSPRADDSYGNFRVHFDLQMKNIIPWSSASGSKFSEKLTKRINRVIAPLLRVKRTEQMEKLEAEKFAVLPLQERIEQILNICISRIKRIGYRGTRVEAVALSPRFPLYTPLELRSWRREGELLRILSLKSGWLGTKFIKGEIHAVFVHVTSTLSKNQLGILYESLLRNPVYNVNPGLKSGTLRRLVEHMYICSLQKVPHSRVMTSLPHFRLDQERNEFIWVEEQTVPRGAIPSDKEVYVANPWTGREGFFVRNLNRSPSGKPDERDWVEGSNPFGLGPSKAKQIKQISRHVHIRIIDEIKFERDFKTVFSDMLKRVESESF